jgi:riboflavin synthase
VLASSTMFTGIITAIGQLVAREGGRFRLGSAYAADSIVIGASIACDGVCLTVTSVASQGEGSVFSVDVSNETLSKTSLGSWQPGRKVNLERALKAADELGGHLVSGHVDAIARLIELHSDGQSRRIVVEAPAHLAHLIAVKGSVALDGVSLTVNEVDGHRFGINIIPHTLTQTTLGIKKPGEAMNLEVDLLARYVARALEYRR